MSTCKSKSPFFQKKESASIYAHSSLPKDGAKFMSLHVGMIMPRRTFSKLNCWPYFSLLRFSCLFLKSTGKYKNTWLAPLLRLYNFRIDITNNLESELNFLLEWWGEKNNFNLDNCFMSIKLIALSKNWTKSKIQIFPSR